MSDLNLGVVGNCSFAALVDRRARIVWCCLPRFDGDPVFNALLDDDGGEDARGMWEVEVMDFSHSEQKYRRNSAVLETTLYDKAGNAVLITDFAPRFKRFDRTFRPAMLVRRVQPVAGTPRVRMRLRPTCSYGAGTPEITRGSNHIRYVMPDETLRLTTDVPPSYVLQETPHVLERQVTMILGPDESMTEGVADLGRRFFEQTDNYWCEWTRQLAVPFEWQEAVIRAAITLKLCSFDETGAVLAALTTSIPEAPHSGRNWDYRCCWLRDAFFVVQALNRLGATRTMESYLGYITNIVAESGDDRHLQPVFGIALEHRLDEREVESLAGYRGMAPVRVGNDAYLQVQNDGYGAVILATAQSFFDHRLRRPGDEILFRRLEHLGEKAVEVWDTPDAGLWELRSRAEVHTFSTVMCWAACDRLARIAKRLGFDDRESYWCQHAEQIRSEILRRAWNSELNSIVSTFDGCEIDASLLLLPELGFLSADDPRFLGTLAFVERRLRRGDTIFRYAIEDDFGPPETAFSVCIFWYIDALAAVGRVEEARTLFERMMAARNHLGLLSEDIDSDTGELWGNFPQTYSLVGLIHSALRLSQPWEEAF